MHDAADPIAEQYSRWAFPEPIHDLSTHPGRQTTDPMLCHRMYWPDRDYPHGLRILVAGCGTNQAAEIAFHNRSAHVLGIDVSPTSLAHEQRLKDRHGLSNLELRLMPIEAANSLKTEFDLITATGVLHHLADPAAGLRALAGRLALDGVISVMVYATLGRFAINLIRTCAQLMGLGQDEASVTLLKELVGSLASNHPSAIAYNGDDRQTRSDAMLVDLFLNARERSFTAQECLALVEGCGLTFQRWMSNNPFSPEAHFDPNTPIYNAITGLDRPAMWSVMECLKKPLDGKHSFIACRADRPRAHWDVNFATSDFMRYVPIPITEGASEETTPSGLTICRRLGANVVLAGDPLTLFRAVDGSRTIRSIVDASAARDASRRAGLERLANELFRRLWACDLIHIRLPAGTPTSNEPATPKSPRTLNSG